MHRRFALLLVLYFNLYIINRYVADNLLSITRTSLSSIHVANSHTWQTLSRCFIIIAWCCLTIVEYIMPPP